MFINRKAIAEKALQEQYGEEFVAYHTWDHGGDSFRASMYPKDDESIKFNTHIFNDGRIIIDYYAEKIVGKEIIEIIKPYIDEIAEESAYFATVPIQDLGYTSKEEVSIEDFYTRAEKDFSDWPTINIAINVAKINDDISYEDEYDILMKIFNDIRLDSLEGNKLALYYISGVAFQKYDKYFDTTPYINGGFDQLPEIENKVYIKYTSNTASVSKNEYVEKRKEFKYE